MGNVRSPVRFVTDEKEIRRCLTRWIRLLHPDATSILKLRIDPVRTTLEAASAFGRYEVDLALRDDQRLKLVVLGSSDIRGSKENAFRMMRFLWQHGFNRKPALIPRPIHYDRSRKFLLYEEMPGLPLFDSFSSRARDLGRLLGLVGQWLAKFHRLTPPGSVPRRTERDDGAKRALYLRTFRKRLPAAQVHQIAQSLDWLMAQKRKALRTAHPSLVHQDVHSRNIIVMPGRSSIAFLDFNDTRRYDAAADVGTFLLHLDASLHAFFSAAKIRVLKSAFLKSYFRHQRIARDRSFRWRVNLHQAWMCYQFWEFSLSYFPPGLRDRNVQWVLRRYETLSAALERSLRHGRNTIIL